MHDILSLCKNPAQIARLKAHYQRIATLIDKGVHIPSPQSIEIHEDVQLDRISGQCTLHTGTKLRGKRTLIAPGAVIGKEGPANLENTVVGPNVRLDGGHYENATFLAGAETRSWSHIRGGTLFEEQAKVAHCVGLKQTILFPFVTLGSLINFCDVLMAGGTSPKDHSEVGSGYIHFNFTPRADKATPSLYGDVPQGVLLRSPRIFLGGLAASVGPMQVGYGAFLGPGEVFRRDVKAGRFTLGERKRHLPNIDFDAEVFTGVRGKLLKNFHFIGQLVALWQWYDKIRLPMADDPWVRATYEGGKESVEMALRERIGQLKKWMARLPKSYEKLYAQGAEKSAQGQEALVKAWPEIQAFLEGYANRVGDDGHLAILNASLSAQGSGGDYLQRIQSLDDAGCAAAQGWLSSIAQAVADGAKSRLP